MGSRSILGTSSDVFTDPRRFILSDHRKDIYLYYCFSIRKNRLMMFMFYIRHTHYRRHSLLYCNVFVLTHYYIIGDDPDGVRILRKKERTKFVYCYKLSTGSMMPPHRNKI